MDNDAVRDAAERLLNATNLADDSLTDFEADIKTVARAALAERRGAGAGEGRLALAESQRETWSDVANQMMHERNAARSEIIRLREELHAHHIREARQWTNDTPEIEDCPRCAALAAPAEAEPLD